MESIVEEARRSITPLQPAEARIGVLKHPLRIAALSISVVALLAVATSTTLLILDYFEARSRLPHDRERRESLELAVRKDVSQVEVLTEEYEKQKEQSFARVERNDWYTGILIASAAIFLAAAKTWLAHDGSAAPTFAQIQSHRGDSSARKTDGKRRRFRAPTNGATAAPEIDLGFVDRAVAEEGRSKEAAVAILQRIQRHYRYLPDEALKRVCEQTEISPAQIAGVSSFYAQFRRSPIGRYVIKICHGTACHVAGAAEITDEVRRSLKIAPESDTDPDRVFTVDQVACVGCCSLAPVLMIEDETVGGLSPVGATEAIEAFRQERQP